MSELLEKVQSYLDGGGVLESLAGNDDIKQVNGPEFVTDSRWFNYYEVVFERNGEYVAVTYAEGATEMQDASEEEPQVYEVVPRQKVVTEYVRLT